MEFGNATRESIKNIDLVWRIDDRFKSQMSAYMERLKELGVIAKIPERDKLVIDQFVEAART